jgi:hypothetical protein
MSANQRNLSPQEEPQENPQGMSLPLGGQLRVGGPDIRNDLGARLFLGGCYPPLFV